MLACKPKALLSLSYLFITEFLNSFLTDELEIRDLKIILQFYIYHRNTVHFKIICIASFFIFFFTFIFSFLYSFSTNNVLLVFLATVSLHFYFFVIFHLTYFFFGLNYRGARISAKGFTCDIWISCCTNITPFFMRSSFFIHQCFLMYFGLFI